MLFAERIGEFAAELVEELAGRCDLSGPFVLFHGKVFADLVARGIEAAEIEILDARDAADWSFKSARAPIDPIEHPLERAHILAVAGPQEFSVVVFAKPVDHEDLRR